MSVEAGDLAVAWPLVLADGTENAKVLAAEVVEVLEVGDDGNSYVEGLESKEKQFIATTSLTLAENWTLRKL